MKRIALTTLIAASLALTATSALALDEATKQAAAACQAPDTQPKDGIAACSKVLSSVKMSPKSTLAMHYYRGVFYVKDSNNGKAAEDFTAAINTYETDPEKATWPVDFVGLAASSYAFRAQTEIAAHNCDAAKTDFKQAAATEREVSQRDQYEQEARNACK